MGAQGRPWAPHVLFLQGKTTKNIKNGLNGVEVAPFGLSLGRNGATGGAEPLGLLPRPIWGLFFFFCGGFGPRAPGPGASGPGALRCGVREAQFTLVYILVYKKTGAQRVLNRCSAGASQQSTN